MSWVHGAFIRSDATPHAAVGAPTPAVAFLRATTIRRGVRVSHICIV